VFEKSDLWENQKVRGSSVRRPTVKLTRVGHDLINVFFFIDKLYYNSYEFYCLYVQLK
jgi:hypothetical protein